ncbi:hypothetical protein MMPV_000158 [Pyropia vietnamensis]
MVLVLVIGDFHVPHRVPSLPARFRSLLVAGRIHIVLCTGNLCTDEMGAYLRSLCPRVYIVRGDMDELDLPDRLIVPVGSLTFGVMGTGAASMPPGGGAFAEAMRRDMGVDVLVGGGGHAVRLVAGGSGGGGGGGGGIGGGGVQSGWEEERRGAGRGLLVDPGTATGAPRVTDDTPPVPTFVLLDVQGYKIIAYTYTLQANDVHVDRTVFDSIKK